MDGRSEKFRRPGPAGARRKTVVWWPEGPSSARRQNASAIQFARECFAASRRRLAGSWPSVRTRVRRARYSIVGGCSAWPAFPFSVAPTLAVEHAWAAGRRPAAHRHLVKVGLDHGRGLLRIARLAHRGHWDVAAALPDRRLDRRFVLETGGARHSGESFHQRRCRRCHSIASNRMLWGGVGARLQIK